MGGPRWRGKPVFVCDRGNWGMMFTLGSFQLINMEEVESWVDQGMGLLQAGFILVRVKVKQQ